MATTTIPTDLRTALRDALAQLESDRTLAVYPDSYSGPRWDYVTATGVTTGPYPSDIRDTVSYTPKIELPWTWHSVDDALPKEPTYEDVDWRRVLASSENGRVELVYYSLEDGTWSNRNGELVDFKVTWWCDLPKPPSQCKWSPNSGL